MKNKLKVAVLILSVTLAFITGFFIGSTITSSQIEIREVEVSRTAQNITHSEIPLPDGRIIKVPAGHKVTIKWRGPDRGIGVSERTNVGKAEGGHSLGKSGSGDSEEHLTPPHIDMTEGREKGSGGALETIYKNTKNGTSVIIFAGLAMVVAGVLVIVFLKNLRIGGICIFAGGALVGTGLLVQVYPWVLLVGVMVVLGIIGYFIYRTWKNGKMELALKRIVGGIERADASSQTAVKAKISDESRSQREKKTIKGVILGVKHELNR